MPKNSFVISRISVCAVLMFSACGGSDGQDGISAGIQTTAEPPGANCANGGIKIEVLQDGTIQQDQTQYICNGSNGSGTAENGTNTAIQTAPEPAGENCANGGIKIEVLQDGTVQQDQTQYICNGSNGNGVSAAIRTKPEPPGANCANGGIKIEVLQDGTVQQDQTQYICNGENGQDGKDGCEGGRYYSEYMGVCVPRGFIGIPAGSMTLSHATASYANGAAVRFEAFALKKTPVTVAEFKKCVAVGACTAEHYNNSSYLSGCNYGRGDAWLSHPMNCVDLYGARDYCEWIGAKVPTEEEWEYAATHNGMEHLNTTYPWGGSAPTRSLANYSNTSTTAPGQYSPAGDSPLGLVDMAGNVWEWVDSLYSSTAQTYAIKGGAWNSSSVSDLSVSSRGAAGPDAKNGVNVGFRCAVSLENLK